jgi:abortive infection bacteriophage resistance protein
MKFNKPPKTFEQQLELLIERGLIVDNKEDAISALADLNYYRLEAYWLPFEISRNPHKFIEGTRFDQVLDLYSFDRELRLHILDAIERIEISLRTRWAYYISHEYGAHAYLEEQKGLIINKD